MDKELELEKKLKSQLCDLETEYDYLLCKEANYLKRLEYHQKIAQTKTKIKHQMETNKSLLESIKKLETIDEEFEPKVVTESMPKIEYETFIANQQKVATWNSFVSEYQTPSPK